MKIQWESFNFELNQFTNEWEELGDSSEEEYSEETESVLSEILSFEDDIKAAISTPWGVFNVTDPFAPYKRFELWIGNTDFNVSSAFITKVAASKGVEIVKPISRYSFIVGIGKLFSFNDVRISIEMAGGVKISEIPKEVHDLISSFGDQKYSVYVYPNQKFEYTIESDSDYSIKVEKFNEEKRKNQGLLLSNG